MNVRIFMRLYCIQHGESLAKEIDPERRLTQQGEQDVQKLAGFLKRGGMPVSAILHSGKTRARQTAEILAEALLPDGKVAAIGGIDPNDPVEPFAAKLAQLGTDTMIVGHLPFMAKLVAHLLTGRTEPSLVVYQPGTVICLEQDEHQRWQVQWMIRPDCVVELPRE